MNFLLPGRRTLLFFGSLLFALYVLAPIAWLVSSSLQSEAEITSVPPHWIPDDPTLYNFAAIFKTSSEVVTYENRKQGDTATGGFLMRTPPTMCRYVTGRAGGVTPTAGGNTFSPRTVCAKQPKGSTSNGLLMCCRKPKHYRHRGRMGSGRGSSGLPGAV